MTIDTRRKKIYSASVADQHTSSHRPSRKSKKFPLWIWLSIACIVIAVGLWIALDGYTHFIGNAKSRDGEAHLIYVYPNTDMDSLVRTIQQTHSLRSEFAFRRHAARMKMAEVKTGCYRISAEESDRALIRRLQLGEQTPVKMTINRIRTRAQLAQRLSSQLMIDSLSIISALEDTAFLSPYGLKKETAVCLFIPDTYEVYWNMSVEQLFDRMNREYQHFWNQTRRDEAAALGLTPVQVATIASIIEEETNKDFEKPIIAGLYLNRLRKGMPLQACPTIKFALQDFSLRRILEKHLAVESPYNTYKHAGLPPGPIRIPTAKAMDAVLHRTPSTYLFMCANPDFSGTHKFSSTYAEHARTARAYQKELNRRKIR